MKLEFPITVKVDFDDVQTMIDELKKLQTYKMFEGDDTTLVELDDVISILAKHIRATHNSSESPNSWIPCSESLPEEKGEYLVTYHPCYWDNVQQDIKVGIDSFRGKTSWAKKKHQRVIAWMPLPEPYKGDEK